MTRSDVLALTALVAVFVLVVLGKLPGEALVTFLGGLAIKSPLVTRSEA